MPLNPLGIPGVDLTRPEIAWLVQQAGGGGENGATAVAIAWAESAGRTNAYRPASANTLGGNDHGLWQLNDRAHPDALRVAYFPLAATEEAARISRGWTDFGPWAYGPTSYRGVSRGDLDLPAARQAMQRPIDPTERIQSAGLTLRAPRPGTTVGSGGGGGSAGSTEPPPGPSWWHRLILFGGTVATSPAGTAIGTADALTGGAVSDTIRSVAGTILSPLDFLRRLAGIIFDPNFWRRIGLGVLGVLLVVAAIIIYTRTGGTGGSTP